MYVSVHVCLLAFVCVCMFFFVCMYIYMCVYVLCFCGCQCMYVCHACLHVHLHSRFPYFRFMCAHTYTVSSDSTPVPAPSSRMHVLMNGPHSPCPSGQGKVEIHLFTDGFTIGREGPLRRLSDPANERFLEQLYNGFAPSSSPRLFEV